MRLIDLTGQTFERLEVLGRDPEYVYPKSPHWLCICACGNVRSIRGDNLKVAVSCGCYRSEMMASIGRQNALPEGSSLRNHLFKIYVANAKRRNLPWEITTGRFETLIQARCHYCGVLPQRTLAHGNKVGRIVYQGVDRRDNSKGYTVENSVPCCWPCNRMKGQLSEKEFLQHIQQVQRHQKETQCLSQ